MLIFAYNKHKYVHFDLICFLFLNKQYYFIFAAFSDQSDVIPYDNHVHQNKGVPLTRIWNSNQHSSFCY